MGINNLSRREFAKLTAAAVGGVVAGTAVNGIAGAEAGTIVDESPLLSGKNVCRGLNPKCGGHKGGSNTCAGQGSCHTANKHTCHGSIRRCPGKIIRVVDFKHVCRVAIIPPRDTLFLESFKRFLRWSFDG